MDKNLYGIETIITLLSLRDSRTTKRRGIRVRHYVLSRDTEEAVDVKKRYLNGGMSKEEYDAWCLHWIDNHDITEEELRYLERSQYLRWLRDYCTKRE